MAEMRKTKKQNSVKISCAVPETRIDSLSNRNNKRLCSWKERSRHHLILHSAFISRQCWILQCVANSRHY